MNPITQPDDEPETLVYTLQETANLLKVSKWTIARLIEEGEIGSILIRTRRLVRATDIRTYLERQDVASVWSNHGK